MNGFGDLFWSEFGEVHGSLQICFYLLQVLDGTVRPSFELDDNLK
jgi:hypothetical protein